MAARLNLSGPNPSGGAFASLGQSLGYKLASRDLESNSDQLFRIGGAGLQQSARVLWGSSSGSAMCTIACVTDGTSNTLLFTEEAAGWIPPSVISANDFFHLWNFYAVNMRFPICAEPPPLCAHEFTLFWDHRALCRIQHASWRR